MIEATDIYALRDMLLDIAEAWTDEPFLRALGHDDDASRREQTGAVLAQVRKCMTLHVLQTILDEADGERSPIFDALRLAAGELAERCVGGNGCCNCFPDGEGRTRFAVQGEEASR